MRLSSSIVSVVSLVLLGGCGTSAPPIPCSPTTCLRQGAACGSIADGCGGTLQCGTCTAPQTCGGGGQPNVCGPVCGNGRVETGEQCDDGNATPGDGCEPNCTFTCVAPADCDDGNPCNGAETCNVATHVCAAGTPAADGTACDADMNPATRDICRAGTCLASVCGDGFVDAGAGEVCDDGNVAPGDGCSADCRSNESCGNGILDALVGETCDDGNTAPGDGCGPTCLLETCGNGVVEAGEMCDDGNHRSGDGCSADCQSNETCGNGILDLSTGEVCDDGNTVSGDGCSADCRSLETCGNGVVDAASGEQCDDGNTIAHDGCSPACRIEQAAIAASLQIGADTTTCDVNLDGTTENALGTAIGPTTLAMFNGGIQGGINDGSVILLFEYLGLDDPLGVFDPSIRVALYSGFDGDTDPTNNLAGGSPFLIDRAALNPDGTPTSAIDGHIARQRLVGGPEDSRLGATGFFVRRAQLSATTANDGVRIIRLDAGILCGALDVQALYGIPNFTGSGGATLLDVVVVGGPDVMATQPDIDLDRDGLERFADTNGDGNIDTCTDGDGTVVAAAGCASDPRFADGYSTVFDFTAVWARIIGVM